MFLRVFEYDIRKAAEIQRLSGETAADGEAVYVLPKSIVIHIEKSESIPNEYRTKIVDVKPDGTEEVINRVVPVVRYWELSFEELVEKKLYPLLPMQVFLLRGKLKKFSNAEMSKEKQEVIQEVKDLAEKITIETRKLKAENEISFEDAGKIVTALNKIIMYLNELYDFDKGLNKEVNIVIRSIFEEIEEETREKVEKEIWEKAEKITWDKVEETRERVEKEIWEKAEKITWDKIEETREETQEETAKEMILDNEPLAKIIRYSKLPEKRIQAIAFKLSKELN